MGRVESLPGTFLKVTQVERWKEERSPGTRWSWTRHLRIAKPLFKPLCTARLPFVWMTIKAPFQNLTGVSLAFFSPQSFYWSARWEGFVISSWLFCCRHNRPIESRTSPPHRKKTFQTIRISPKNAILSIWQDSNYTTRTIQYHISNTMQCDAIKLKPMPAKQTICLIVHFRRQDKRGLW